MSLAMMRYRALLGFTSIFCMSSSSQIICLLFAGEGFFPFWVAVNRLGSILSQFTLKVSGQFALLGKGGEEMGLLETEELWSSAMHVNICLGGAEIGTGSGMVSAHHVLLYVKCRNYFGNKMT